MVDRLVKMMLLGVAATMALVGSAQAGVDEVETVLVSYATDYEQDPSFREDATFGVLVDHDWWTIEANAETRDVRVFRGAPDTPTYYFEIFDESTIHRMDRGELNVQTAMVQARWTDPVPMTIKGQDGYEAPDNFVHIVEPLNFHFFTRGIPEVIPFADEYSRAVHGAHAVVFFYDKGLRSSWGYMAPGDHANADTEDQTNPFNSMFIITRGQGMARIGGREMILEEGQTIFIPEGMAHELWNPNEEDMEFVLIMFGENA